MGKSKKSRAKEVVMRQFSPAFFIAYILSLLPACSNNMATKEMEAKAIGLYRGKITFAQGSQHISLELRETGHYTLSYNSIVDSFNIARENGVYVLGSDGKLQLARRSLNLRNFSVSDYNKLLVLNSEGRPYTTYSDSSFYLDKISKIAD